MDPPSRPAAQSGPRGRRTLKDPDSLWGPRYRTETMVFAALIFLVGFAALALVTCLPLAAASLHGQDLYVLAYGGFTTAGLLATAVAGDLCDRYGPRRPLAVGLAGSVGGLLICGSAGSIWQLIAGRMVDGFAGGLVAVALYVTAAESYPARSRAKALALMSAAGALFAAALGVHHPAHGFWAPYAVALALPTALAALAFLLAGRAQPAVHCC